MYLSLEETNGRPGSRAKKASARRSGFVCSLPCLALPCLTLAVAGSASSSSLLLLPLVVGDASHHLAPRCGRDRGPCCGTKGREREISTYARMHACVRACADSRRPSSRQGKARDGRTDGPSINQSGVHTARRIESDGACKSRARAAWHGVRDVC